MVNMDYIVVVNIDLLWSTPCCYVCGLITVLTIGQMGTKSLVLLLSLMVAWWL